MVNSIYSSTLLGPRVDELTPFHAASSALRLITLLKVSISVVVHGHTKNGRALGQSAENFRGVLLVIVPPVSFVVEKYPWTLLSAVARIGVGGSEAERADMLL